MAEFSLIAALSKNKVIGSNGSIPWNIPGEQSRFKELTTGNVVIMGRKTFEEIFAKLKKPLPGRINLIVSRTKDFSKEGCPTFDNLADAINFCKINYPKKNVFIGGGALLYKEAVSTVDKMYLTEIDMDVEGDVFFPEFDGTDFKKTVDKSFSEPVPYRYVTYTRL